MCVNGGFGEGGVRFSAAMEGGLVGSPHQRAHSFRIFPGREHQSEAVITDFLLTATLQNRYCTAAIFWLKFYVFFGGSFWCSGCSGCRMWITTLNHPGSFFPLFWPGDGGER